VLVGTITPHHIAFDGSIGHNIQSKSIVLALILSAFFYLPSSLFHLCICITRISLNHQILANMKHCNAQHNEQWFHIGKASSTSCPYMCYQSEMCSRDGPCSVACRSFSVCREKAAAARNQWTHEAVEVMPSTIFNSADASVPTPEADWGPVDLRSMWSWTSGGAACFLAMLNAPWGWREPRWSSSI
jgi:hypothetical protein